MGMHLCRMNAHEDGLHTLKFSYSQLQGSPEGTNILFKECYDKELSVHFCNVPFGMCCLKE